MEYRISTTYGVLHAQVLPTLPDVLGDQPWQVKLRAPQGDLLLSCFVDESSASEAAEEAVKTFLAAKRASIKKYRFV